MSSSSDTNWSPSTTWSVCESAFRRATVSLAAYFFSRDVERVWQVAERLEYGIVGGPEASRG